jgi:hypothetical protein
MSEPIYTEAIQLPESVDNNTSDPATPLTRVWLIVMLGLEIDLM